MPAHIKDVPVKELSTYSQDSFEGGINMNSETAQPNEVIDSRNMWAPVNLLESRPGKKLVGVQLWQVESTNSASTYISFTASGSTYSAEGATSSVTFGAAVGDILYFKYTPSGGSLLSDWSGVTIDMSAGNTAAARMIWEYWNGEAWVYLDVVSGYASSGNLISNIYLGPITGAVNYVRWVLPSNITTTSVNSIAGYSVRLRITDVSSSVSLTTRNIDLVRNRAVTDRMYYSYLNKISWADGSQTFVSFLRTNSQTPSNGLMVSPVIANATNKFKGADFGLNYYGSFKPPYRDFDLTTLPEYTCGFISIDGLIFAIYKNDMTNNAVIVNNNIYDYTAQVEDDLNIVGETKDLSRTFIPQESVYPHSSYVLWINSFLFHARTTDNPYIVRWSAPSSFSLKGYKVWPKASQTTVLGDDLSPIVGMKAFGEQPIVFKRHSMWRMIYVGPGDDNLGLWEAAKISGGVGTISNSSIQITPVGMVHVYEDGVYLFDGVKSTKIGGDKIQEFWDYNINLTNPVAFVSGHWKSKHCYLLSLPTKDRAGLINNKVLVWDYVDNAFWIWDNIQVTSFYSDTVNNVSDDMYFSSDDGAIYQLNGNSDNGTAIDSYIITHRFGYKDNRPKSMRQVYIGSTPESGQVLTSVITNDRDIGSSGTMVFTDPKEPEAGTLLWNQGKFTSTTKRRFRHLNFRERGKWFQVKAEHNINNKPFKLTQVQLGVYTPVQKIR